MFGVIFKKWGGSVPVEDDTAGATNIEWIFPLSKGTSQSYYLQETRNLAFKLYNESMAEDACHNNMPDLIRNDPVLASHLLREATEILTAEREPFINEEQRRVNERALISTAIIMDKNHKQESKKRSKAKAKEMKHMIALDRKESFKRELRQREGFWEKMKWRLECCWRQVESEEERNILGTGPLYNPYGWSDLEQMTRFGDLQNVEDH